MARILIADNKEDCRESEAALNPLGHQIFHAYDGEEAQKTLDAHPVDLLLLDVVLPKLNGFALCRVLREDLRYRDLPILVLSSLDRASDRLWALKQGANEFLIKPISAHELRQHISSFLTI